MRCVAYTLADLFKAARTGRGLNIRGFKGCFTLYNVPTPGAVTLEVFVGGSASDVSVNLSTQRIGVGGGGYVLPPGASVVLHDAVKDVITVRPVAWGSHAFAAQGGAGSSETPTEPASEAVGYAGTVVTDAAAGLDGDSQLMFGGDQQRSIINVPAIQWPASLSIAALQLGSEAAAAPDVVRTGAMGGIGASIKAPHRVIPLEILRRYKRCRLVIASSGCTGGALTTDQDDLEFTPGTDAVNAGFPPAAFGTTFDNTSWDVGSNTRDTYALDVDALDPSSIRGPSAPAYSTWGLLTGDAGNTWASAYWVLDQGDPQPGRVIGLRHRYRAVLSAGGAERWSTTHCLSSGKLRVRVEVEAIGGTVGAGLELRVYPNNGGLNNASTALYMSAGFITATGVHTFEIPWSGPASVSLYWPAAITGTATVDVRHAE